MERQINPALQSAEKKKQKKEKAQLKEQKLGPAARTTPTQGKFLIKKCFVY